MNLLTTDELISTIGGLLIQWDETLDFDIELYRKNAPLLEGLLFYEEFNQNIHSDVLLFCLCPQLIVGLTGYAWV